MLLQVFHCLVLRYLPISEVEMHLLFAIWLSAVLPSNAERYSTDNGSSKVRFDVGSTLHNVPADITRFTAELEIKDTISGKLTVQSDSITTGIGVRDKRLYSYCLSTDQYPTIDFNIRSVSGDTEAFQGASGSGTITLHGALKIRSTTKDFAVPAQFTWNETGVALKGTTPLSWSDFGIPDPSILISKVEPVLNLEFDLNLEKRP